MKITRTCAGCKQQIHKSEMLQYASATGKTLQWYCKDCYEEKIAREKFSKKVCQIFQLKSPGPIIWTQRKRLRDKYGYTDDTIIDCLDYLYEVKHMDKLSETLVLVNPRNVSAMRSWKATQKALGGRLIAASGLTEVQEKIVDIPESKPFREEINLDDGLYDD